MEKRHVDNISIEYIVLMESNLSVYKNIEDFEKQLEEFVGSVQRFDPDVSKTNAFLSTESKLDDFIKLAVNHTNFGNNLKQLQIANSSLDKSILSVLNSLNEARSILLDLPNNDDEEDDDDDYDEHNKTETQVNEQPKNLDADGDTEMDQNNTKTNIFGTNPLTTKELLEYSAKLAKFTTAPATTDLNIGPNNYIWPAEDALRRGMLATAVKYGDELIKTKKSSDQTEALEKENFDAKPAETDGMGVNHESGHEIQNSFETYNVADAKVEQNESATVALDLFNSDDESD